MSGCKTAFAFCTRSFIADHGVLLVVISELFTHVSIILEFNRRLFFHSKMSLASLAAYASSDESDSEQEESGNLDGTHTSGVPGPSALPAASPSQEKSGVDLIEDEDDHLAAPASVTSTLPQAEGREDSAGGSLFQANDIVDDVPLASKIQAEKPPKSQKVKISIPSLSQV